jgi:hypothetical protein
VRLPTRSRWVRASQVRPGDFIIRTGRGIQNNQYEGLEWGFSYIHTGVTEVNTGPHYAIVSGWTVKDDGTSYFSSHTFTLRQRLKIRPAQ